MTNFVLAEALCTWKVSRMGPDPILVKSLSIPSLLNELGAK